MKNEKIETLARTIVNFSVGVKKGDYVIVKLLDEGSPLANAIINAVYDAGGFPILKVINQDILVDFIGRASEEQLKSLMEDDMFQIKKVRANIVIDGTRDPEAFSEIPTEKMDMYRKVYKKPISDYILANMPWCLVGWPTEALAKGFDASLEEFTDFYWDVMSIDYKKMSDEMDKLVKLMNATDKVRIVGPGTDISFSIKGINAIKCAGNFNLPDGEVYTAPVKDSVNGRISYNTSSIYSGFKYENVVLDFVNGKIVKATANDSERINKLFDTDEGARYVGEFAIGLNPYITRTMGDILFDEKIAGSIHFTPGECYEDADNGNKSAIHWDLVLLQASKDGGGEIWFDDVLVRKNGLFVLEELKGLNPENLK